MSEPTLSVIIPSWNEEECVGRAIESLQRAAFVYERERGATIEIIVVDKTSTDRTADVARQQGATSTLVETHSRFCAVKGCRSDQTPLWVMLTANRVWLRVAAQDSQQEILRALVQQGGAL